MEAASNAADTNELKKELYSLAWQYRKTHLWKKLADCDIFAAKLPGGETGYICVMGKQTGNITLAVYPGEAGYQSYINLEMTGWDHIDQIEQEIRGSEQNCLQCIFGDSADFSPEERKENQKYAKALGIRLSGKNMRVSFQKFVPGMMSRRVTEKEDIEKLIVTLKTAIGLTAYLTDRTPAQAGIVPILSNDHIPVFAAKEDGTAEPEGTVERPERKLPARKTPQPLDEFTLAKLKKLHAGAVAECRLTKALMPVAGDDPYWYPTILYIVDAQTGMVDYILQEGAFDPDEMQRRLADEFVRMKYVPARIQVCDDRTEAFLKDFCSAVGIRLSRVKELPGITEVYNDMVSSFYADDGTDGNFGLEDIMQMVQMLESLTDKELASVPGEARRMISEMVDAGIGDASLQRRFKALLRRMN